MCAVWVSAALMGAYYASAAGADDYNSVAQTQHFNNAITCLIVVVIGACAHAYLILEGKKDGNDSRD